MLYSGKEIKKILNYLDEHISSVSNLKFSKLPNIPVDETDFAIGGALLSAAELESNKNYMDLNDGTSTLAYSVFAFFFFFMTYFIYSHCIILF